MVLQDYGQAPAHQNPIAYTAVGLPTKPGNVFDRAPTTADIDYPLGFEWLYQVDAGTSNIYCRVPDSTVWQLLEGSASGVIPVDNGGTGRNTLTDHAIIIGSGTSPVDFVGPGASGTVLQGAGGSADPAFSTTTYPATSSQGDVIYASADDTYSNLAKDTNATRYLSNTGASNNPAWAQVDLTNGVTGVLPVANGGSGSAGASGAIETTDATPTALITFPCGATAGVYTFDIRVAGFANIGAGAPLAIGYTIVGSIRTDGAAATFINQAVDSFEEGAMSSCSGTLAVSGNNALVTVTGVAAYTIDWVGNLQFVFADATT